MVELVTCAFQQWIMANLNGDVNKLDRTGLQQVILELKICLAEVVDEHLFYEQEVLQSCDIELIV